MKTCIIALMCFFISYHAMANPPIFLQSSKDAEKISKELDMSIITIVSADWCVYCKKLDKTISENLSTFDNMIILKLDFDKDKSAIKQHRIKKIPTIIYKDKIYTGKYQIDDLKRIINN